MASLIPRQIETRLLEALQDTLWFCLQDQDRLAKQRL